MPILLFLSTPSRCKFGKSANPTMMNKCLRIASYLLLLAVQSGATIIQNNGDMNCTYPVSMTVDSISCNNETDYCHLGDTMSVYGTITLEENLPSSVMCATTKVCFKGYSFACRTYKKQMNVCHAVGVSDSYDGTACPNAGTFDFGSTVKIPGRSGWSFGSGKCLVVIAWVYKIQQLRICKDV